MILSEAIGLAIPPVACILHRWSASSQRCALLGIGIMQKRTLISVWRRTRSFTANLLGLRR